MKKNKTLFLRFLKPYRKYFILAVIAIIIECGLEISIPFLMNQLLDNGMTPTFDESGNIASYTLNLQYTLGMGGIMVGFAVVAFGLGIITAKFTAKAGRGFGYELRKEEFKKIQNFSFKELDEFRINSLVTRMTNDVQIISDTFCQVLRPLLRAPLQLVFSFVFAIIMSKQLSIVFGIIVPLLAVLLTVVLLISKPLFVKVQGALDEINRTTQESLVAMKLVRANSKKEYEISKFTKVNNEVKDIGTKSFSIGAWNMAIMEFMTYACILGILFVGGKLSLSDTTGRMINNISSFLSYVMQVLASLNMLSNVFMTFTRSEASTYRIAQVFNSQNEIVDKKDSKLKITDGSVSFNDVSFKYNDSAKENVLSDISFKINDGDFVGILGQTGSSKTTLVYLLDRFYDVTSGSIEVSNNNIKDYSLAELRKNIAISFQNPTLFSGTIEDNLRWGNPLATEEEIIKACKIAGCYDFIMEKFPAGFKTKMGQTGSNVSGGQRQRICLARAILKKPKILILDDSFSALDRITEAEVKHNLKYDLPHMTKIVISQKVSTIEDADKIIVLNEGKLNYIGTSDELIKKDPIYQSIYKIQTEGLKA
jgi:ATP-binding cassette subfamily B protein